MVADVMITRPKTLPGEATVRDVRLLLEDDHTHMALLVTNGHLLGTLVHDDLPSTPTTDETPAVASAMLVGRTVPPTASALEAYRWLRVRRARRLAVVTPDGELAGLLCLNRRLTGFCQDADVAARAGDRRIRRPGERS
jgi:CBS domain-containing protein